MFEPSNGQLEPKGLYSQEYDGSMLVPMVNVHGASTQLLDVGCVQPLDVVPVLEPGDVCCTNTTCASVDTVPVDSGHLAGIAECGSGKQFVLETDASGLGLGAVLSQEKEGQLHPIAYASRTLDIHECNYGISELETLGLVWAVRHFRPYVLGHHTVVYTDHAACTSLLNNPRPTGKLARWALTIQEMDLEIKHRSGKSLSRNPIINAVETFAMTNGEDEAIPRPDVEQMTKLKEAQRSDPELLDLCRYLEADVLPTDEKRAKRIVLESDRFELIHGVLHYEPPTSIGRLCVVVPRSDRDNLLQEGHASCFAGHFSAKKVYDRLRRHYWWKGMRADVYHFCRKCLVCASRKGPGRAVRPPLVPIPVGAELMCCSCQLLTRAIVMLFVLWTISPSGLSRYYSQNFD